MKLVSVSTANLCLGIVLACVGGCRTEAVDSGGSAVTDAANKQVAQEVALAEVHLKHGDHAKALQVVNRAIANRDATEGSDAIALLDRVISARNSAETVASQPQQPIESDKPKRAATQKSTANGDAGVVAKSEPPSPQPVAVKDDAPKPSSASATDTSAKSKPVAKTGTTDAKPSVKNSVGKKAAEAPAKPKPDDAILVSRKSAPDAGSLGSARAVIAALRVVVSGSEGLKLIKSYLKRPKLKELDRRTLAPYLKRFQERSDKDLVRNGASWVTKDQARQRQQEADQLIRQSAELLKVRDYKGAHDLLVQASRTDRNGIRASFLLGLLNTPVFFNDAREAEAHFKTVLARSPSHVSATNNLALTSVRLGRISTAVALWRKASESAPRTPEVTQNLGRLLTEATARRLVVSASEVKKTRTLYAGLTASGKGKSSDPKVGWMYMPLTLSRDEKRRTDLKVDNAKLVHSSLGSGFVVAPGIILTNRHVVDDADVVKIVSPGDRQTEYMAEVLAISPDSDLALVRCQQLKAPPVSVSLVIPRRSSDVMVLGFPKAFDFGQNLKATRGAVTALPDPAHNDMLLYDAVTNAGNSGGPVCDSRGAVVAVHAMGFNFAGKYGGGVPFTAATLFLKSHNIDFREVAADRQPMPWPDVDALVSKSTVMVNIYKQEVALGLTAREDYKRNYLEDITCSSCSGAASVKCRMRKCVKGRISFIRQVNVGRNPVTGAAILEGRVFKKACERCGGNGSLPCRQCIGGIDPRLRIIGG